MISPALSHDITDFTKGFPSWAQYTVLTARPRLRCSTPAQDFEMNVATWLGACHVWVADVHSRCRCCVWRMTFPVAVISPHFRCCTSTTPLRSMLMFPLFVSCKCLQNSDRHAVVSLLVSRRILRDSNCMSFAWQSHILLLASYGCAETGQDTPTRYIDSNSFVPAHLTGLNPGNAEPPTRAVYMCNLDVHFVDFKVLGLRITAGVYFGGCSGCGNHVRRPAGVGVFLQLIVPARMICHEPSTSVRN